MNADWKRAAEAGDAAELRELLEAGADVDAKDPHGQTAVMLAAHRGYLEALGVLLEGAPDLDHTAKYHLSALMLGTISGHLLAVEMLADAGADLRITGTGAPGFAGKTALELAEDLNRTAIVGFLRKRMGA